MADVKMPKSIPCKFDAKGWAPCKKASTNGWCSKHEKAKCSSCGAQATQTCDEGIGGLACGQYLCDNCHHSLNDNNHVTDAVYQTQFQERTTQEETGVEPRWALVERGVPTDIPLPNNLAELLAGDRKGWNLVQCYALELTHTLMGVFPAVQKGTKIIFLTADKKSLFRVWRTLEPQSSNLVVQECMVNATGNVAYAMKEREWEMKESRPLKLYNPEEIEALFSADPAPFKWARGLIGGSSNPHNFLDQIQREEAKLLTA